MRDFPAFLVTLSFDKSDENRVTVAFTFAVEALKKGHTAGLVLLIEGVRVAEQGHVDTIDIGAPFRPVKELLDEFLALGGKLYICAACLHHNHVENLMPEAIVITGPDIVDFYMNAKSVAQFN
ncbi:sulfur reduction protein DsrE [Heliobacterium undosum]|uniref:Sulfur reduction protein DsrE n=1 Tax=Heliomicrobium undosum TaxID=121734 RepID=A0A845LAF0_9FIRM|nr:DsrE family protein [Heliomicrobium undosum]MZP30668.1 sulfur reduction protein DsrE [Heliomicrobium undosum]